MESNDIEKKKRKFQSANWQQQKEVDKLIFYIFLLNISLKANKRNLTNF